MIENQAQNSQPAADMAAAHSATRYTSHVRHWPCATLGQQLQQLCPTFAAVLHAHSCLFTRRQQAARRAALVVIARAPVVLLSHAPVHAAGSSQRMTRYHGLYTVLPPNPLLGGGFNPGAVGAALLGHDQGEVLLHT